MSKYPSDVKARIVECSTPVPFCGCWIWDLRLDRNGYGIINLRGKGGQFAHRESYRAFRGEPSSLLVCHKCDTPACVNPDHLFLGTNLDNLLDRYSKGRTRLGEAKNRFLGTSWNRVCSKWQGMFGHNRKIYYVGVFSDRTEAALAVKLARAEHIKREAKP